jgi:hypothetical protein
MSNEDKCLLVKKNQFERRKIDLQDLKDNNSMNSSIDIAIENILCDKEKSLDQVRCRANQIHHGDKDEKGKTSIRLHIVARNDLMDTKRTVKMKIEIDRQIPAKTNNLDETFDLRENNSLP